MEEAPLKPEMSAARKAAFDKCRQARAAALERKRAAKEEAAKPPPPPAPEPEPEPEAEPEPEPAPAEPEPDLYGRALPPPAAAPPADDLDFIDASQLTDMLTSQAETLKSMKEELAAMRAAQDETAQRASDIGQSLAQHGVKTAYSLNFV
jgi:hypothetical protein